MGRPYRVVWASGDSGGGPKLAERAIAFRAPLLGGGEVDVATWIGHRPFVLVFWASWCGPCRAEAPHLAKLYERYGDRVAFLSVSIDEAGDRAAVDEAVRELGIPYPVALDPDGAVMARYAAGASIPLSFVFDATGAARFRHHNFQPGDERALAAAVSAVAGAAGGAQEATERAREVNSGSASRR
ncbi:MAG: TlpA family protein disulfide reductase [Deltaproteobacteria bacterium]|nr:MAG: TlpA family protein disulfide reductase [Deltaproteobacteria bacterium]